MWSFEEMTFWWPRVETLRRQFWTRNGQTRQIRTDFTDMSAAIHAVAEAILEELDLLLIEECWIGFTSHPIIPGGKHS